MLYQIATLSNLLTLSRIIAAPITVALILQGSHYIMIALLLFTLAGCTDFFDGYFARKYNTATTIGAFFDPLADKILILSLLFSFYWIGAVQLWIVLLIALRDIVVTGIRVISINEGTTFVTSNAAKWKTTIQFVVIYVLFLASSMKNASTFAAVTLMMYGIAGFTVWTGITYLVTNMQPLKNFFTKT